MHKVTRLNSQAGFTLVEIIVSLMILLVTVAGVYASFVAAQRYTISAKHRIAAVNFARKQFEELRPYVRQDTWNNNTAGVNLLYAPNTGSPQIYPPVSVDLSNGWLANVSYNVASTDTTTNRTVTVNVTWTEPD